MPGTTSHEFIDLQEVRQRDGESINVQHRNDEDFMVLPGTQVEQLRQRIRVLESTVTSQNIELQEKEVLKRNYNAVVERLNRVTTEKDAFEEDRERLFRELKFYKEQTGRYVKEIETCRERINESNKQIVQMQNIEEKVKKLEEDVVFWRGKYENEKRNTKEDHASSLKTKKSNDRSQMEQNSECDTDVSPYLKRRKRTFCQSPTALPRCKNCLTVFDRLKPHEVQCRFHRSLPHPWKTWKKQVAVKGRNSDLEYGNNEGYMYWPCCEHVGLKEPPGCLKLKSHDLIYPND